MKITVAFKILPDTAMLKGAVWRADENLHIDLSYVKREFNCFDESALELALRLKESCPGPNSLEALTIDGPRADTFLRHLYAVDYDDAVRIEPPAGRDLRFAPALVSEIISACLPKSETEQIVLLGMQGGVGDNRQTGFMLAERLGWPCIREVMDLAPADRPGCLKVTSRAYQGILTRVVSPPLVLIIGNVPQAAFLRAPNIRRRMQAGQKPLTVLRLSELGLDGAALGRGDKTLLGLERPEPEGRCIMLEGGNPAEKALRLYEDYLRERLGL